MQQPPVRLTLTIWSAFKAARPAHRGPCRSLPQLRPAASARNARSLAAPRCSIASQARLYSSSQSDIDKKAEDAKQRIEESLGARADAAAAKADDKLKNAAEETIVHTLPESSSIVYEKAAEGEAPAPNPEAKKEEEEEGERNKEDVPHWSNNLHSELLSRYSKAREQMPSQLSSRYSQARHRFNNFMDNLQTHIFTASRRLNDLTGYSGIEALKREIDNLERRVQSTRQAVKTARSHYAEAIATRSTTQREVNDLLHRKHTWTPVDLERFTSLYRSDHANEQTESAASKAVAEAEAAYEEASTKLARAILARYHEEQIWSDKIRQMSTWGTWGLMGLNVLLFIVFQILVEPWRRRRLVRGFEEKVEHALRERDEERATHTAAMAQLNQTLQSQADAAAQQQQHQPLSASAAGSADLSAAQKTDVVADNIAEAIVDAVTGTTDPDLDAPSSIAAPEGLAAIEDAAEAVVASEIVADQAAFGSPDVPVPDTAGDASESGIPLPPTLRSSQSWFAAKSLLAPYEDGVRALFSTDKTVTLSQRALTAFVVEGVVAGAACMGIACLLLLRPR